MSAWFDHYGFDEVAPSLLIGAYPQDADDVQRLREAGITRVINLVQDREYEEGAREACLRAHEGAGIMEERLELVDFGGLTPDQIERAARTVLDWLAEGERVYLHCRAGRQRSATVAAAVITQRDAIGPLDALERIRRRRPEADPLPHQREDLATWWTARRR